MTQANHLSLYIVSQYGLFDSWQLFNPESTPGFNLNRDKINDLQDIAVSNTNWNICEVKYLPGDGVVGVYGPVGN